jgi:hypothetical protein
MNEKMVGLMRRRGELLAKIATQRDQLGEIGKQLQIPLALADRGVAAVRFLRGHPLLTAGVATFVVIRRRGLAGLLRGAWRLWKGYRYVTGVSAKLSQRSQVS